MKVRCTKNKGKDLRPHEYKSICDDSVFGRFGVSAVSEYNALEICKEYLVMGVIIFETHQAYLIDDNGFISTYPCQLFELSDDRINADWHFRMVDKDENIYPYIQSIFGYSELCSDKESYEKLIVEKEEEATRIYFRRKIELENL